MALFTGEAVSGTEAKRESCSAGTKESSAMLADEQVRLKSG